MIRHTCRSGVPERWSGLVVVEVTTGSEIDSSFSRFTQVLHLAKERCIVSSSPSRCQSITAIPEVNIASTLVKDHHPQENALYRVVSGDNQGLTRSVVF